MPAAPADESGRRSVVPQAAGRSLWLAAVWTGVGAVVVCATIAVVAVAVCWLPVSGPSGHSMSAVRAGLLTFLASVHGGITIDGAHTQFLPLGMLVGVALAAWRAGTGLADAVAAMDEHDPVRMALAAVAQAASFAVGCAVAVPLATLGTSSASTLSVGAAAFVLFAVTGGAAFVRSTELRSIVAARIPGSVGGAARTATACIAVYAAASAVLVGGSLIMHAGRVEELSREVGGGWGGVPVLLLGLLAVPNAVLAGVGYLAGPGFAVGAGTAVGPVSTAHGVVPSFPLLGALPEGDGASALVWCLVVATPLLAAACVARVAWRAGGWGARFQNVGLSAVIVGAVLLVLTWQAGGGIGSGRLRTVGASPWQVGLIVGIEVAVLGVAGLGLVAAAQRLRLLAAQQGNGWTFGAADAAAAEDPDDDLGLDVAGPRFTVIRTSRADEADDADELAG